MSDLPIVSPEDYIRCVVAAGDRDSTPVDGNVLVTRTDWGSIRVRIYNRALVADFTLSAEWARKLALALTEPAGGEAPS